MEIYHNWQRWVIAEHAESSVIHTIEEMIECWDLVSEVK